MNDRRPQLALVIALAAGVPAAAEPSQSRAAVGGSRPSVPAGLRSAPVDAVPAIGQVEFNGVRYRVEKTVRDGAKTTLYHDGIRAFTAEELRAHVAAQPARVIHADAASALAGLPPGQPIELIVILRFQPAAPISRRLYAPVRPILEELSTRIRQVTSRSLPQTPMPLALERALVVLPLPPADRQACRELAGIYDDLERETRIAIAHETAVAVRPGQAALAEAVEALGGVVIARIQTMNILGVRLPAGEVERLAAHPLVAAIELNRSGKPELDHQKVSLGLTTGFWLAGFDGGVFDAGILDTGVAQDHPALIAHPFISPPGLAVALHGTAVAGIIASTDAVYRGVAFGCDTLVIGDFGMPSPTLLTAMTGIDYIAATGEPEVVNVSDGLGTANIVDYSGLDMFFDAAIDTFNFTVAKSAGNNGCDDVTNPPPIPITITVPAAAFNLLAVGNIRDWNTDTRSDDHIQNSSSVGPTLGNRKKPDLCAPGNDTHTCNNDWAAGPDFIDFGGTSAAAPHVAGAVLLLQDQGPTPPEICRAVLINTADAMSDNDTCGTPDDIFVVGSHWDRRYGWGYLNLAQAYLHGRDAWVRTIFDSPPSERYRFFSGPMFAGDKATLVWNKHAAYDGTMVPTEIEMLSDLDLEAYRASDNLALASSSSAIDNVEQIDVDADTPDVVLKVHVVGFFDPDIEYEAFGLAAQEGFLSLTGPGFVPGFSIPANIAPGTIFQVGVSVTNTGDLRAHGVTCLLQQVPIVTGPNPAPIGALGPGQGSHVQWSVRAPTLPGDYPISVSVRSNSYGETFGATRSTTFRVGSPCYPNCDGSTAPPVLNVNDFICFQGRFAAADPYANCDGSTAPPVLNVNDFICFQARFAAGCS